jgi:glycosyltransferase involved in cell wall biosynthesis
VRAKTRVLYQYADWPAAFEAMDRNLPIPKLGRYAVVIGTLEPRKNLSLLLESLSEPAIRNSDLRFVVVGRKGWKVDAFMVKLTPKERDRVIFSGFVSEFVKYRLLKHCEFLVFPSLYEGFGIPALEAMLLGKPVLASMTSSFPEVIGKAGTYFDPCSTTDFATAFQDIADPRKQAELGAHARSHAAQFSAQAMGRTLAEWALAG